MESFARLGLKNEIVSVLSKLNYKGALEVQEKIIPLTLKNKNVVFTSRTGSGKTIAYLLGFLAKINKKLSVQMMIIVPTRELCIQVGKEIKNICEPLGINVGMLYGGREIAGDYRTVNKKNHIIVGTPGRLIQHINTKTIKAGEVKCIVFDESDQMFDNGFYDDCSYIKQRASKDAQIILSSATISEKVKKFMEEEIVDYELLNIGTLIPKNIVQKIIYCEKAEKNDIILRLFRQIKFKRAIVFCNTRLKSSDISEFLENNNLNSKPISGDLKEDERKNYLNLFKEGKISILVATDVAARGLHIQNVDIIVNYDVPTKKEFYIHRIGRTGRNDKHGYSLTLICPEDIERFSILEAEYGLKVGLMDTNLKEIEKKEIEKVPGQ